MLRPVLGGAASVALLPVVLAAQVYTGTFVTTNEHGGQTTLTLQQAGTKVAGTLAGNGATFRLEGVLEEGTVVGTITGVPGGGGLWFEAELDAADLHLTLIGSGADGKPDYDRATTLVFSRQDAVAGVGSAPNPLAGGTATRTTTDPWVGSFTDGTLVLRLEGGGGQYAGTVQAGGRSFQLSVRGTGEQLAGTFRSADGEFPLTLQRSGEGMVVETGGTRYALQPADGTASPLAAGSQGGAPALSVGPREGGLDDGTPLGREWSQFLAGKKATKISSYSSGSSGGYSSQTEVHLCPDGQFALTGSSSVSVDVGGASAFRGGNASGEGRWRIVTQGQIAGIELQSGNGAVEQYRLDYQNNQMLVNGERWYITPSERCGGGS
jgi:hypothetical protein